MKKEIGKLPKEIVLERTINDNALVALALLIAESNPKQKIL